MDNKEIAQRCYEEHRKLWLGRILKIINEETCSACNLWSLPEDLRLSMNKKSTSCFGCAFDNYLFVYPKDDACQNCLFKPVDIQGKEVECCDGDNTAYTHFCEALELEDKEGSIRWAWEVYYHPMSERWMRAKGDK